MSGQAGTRPWDARIAARLVAPLARTRVTPNHLTTLRLLFGVLACMALAIGTYASSIAGALFFFVSHFLDHTDGELARITGRTSRFGHLYDLTCDVLAYLLLFIGIGAGLSEGGRETGPILLGVLAGGAVAAIFHMRHDIEMHIGHEDARQPHWGALDAEDILYLLPVVALAGKLPEFLLLSAVGAPLFGLWVLRDFLALRRAQP
jgi:phosphatidylglycerophosphate synthase